MRLVSREEYRAAVAASIARNPLVQATIRARERTGDPCIAVTVKAGRFNLVRFVPVAGKRSPERIVLAPGLTGPQVIAALDAYTFNPAGDACPDCGAWLHRHLGDGCACRPYPCAR